MKSFILPLYRDAAVEITRAEDCYLYDEDGTQYVDAESGVWCCNIGHCNPFITKIIEQQSKYLIHHGYSFYNRFAQELSQKLNSICHVEEGRSVFLSSGSESINLAITLAIRLTHREKLLTIGDSFLSSYGYGMHAKENTNLIRIPDGDYDTLDNTGFESIAAFVFEPGTYWGLVHFASEEFVRVISDRAHKNGCLIIVDEVTTGFGRTGKWFGYEHYGLNPDIVVTGKGLGNGYPVSAVTVTSSVAGLFGGNPFRYAQSHQNDALGCAIALGVIEFMNNHDLIHRSAIVGNEFKNSLEKIRNNHQIIREIRGKGLMLAVEFNDASAAAFIYGELFKRGIAAGLKENILRFMPPLTIKGSDLKDIALALEELLLVREMQ